MNNENKINENLTRSLVTIERVLSIRKHPNADTLYIARVQGYDVIVTLPTFNVPVDAPEQLVGVLGVFFEIDSLLPETLATWECFSYLKDRRVRTIRLRGEISQGLFLNLETFKEIIPDIDTLNEGDDITEKLNVTKYYALDDPENPFRGSRGSHGSRGSGRRGHKSHGGKPNPDMGLHMFPNFIPKTDEERLQKNLWFLSEMRKHREWACTLKVDGQSATFYYDPSSGKSGICSRNYEIGFADVIQPMKDHKVFLGINDRYKILDQLIALNEPLAIQGEIYGYGINKNRLRLDKGEYEFAVFNIYRFVSGAQSTGEYLPHPIVKSYAEKLGLPLVPELALPDDAPLDTMDFWVKFASATTYDTIAPESGLLAEGIVVKACDGKEPYISFKVISPLYLAQHGL